MVIREHQRQSIRLAGYDYRDPGAYFVTICLQDRGYLFGEVLDGTMCPSALGAIVDACWRALPTHFPRLTLDAHVVMPDHLHGILVLAGGGAPVVDGDHIGSATPRGTLSGSVGAIVQSFKKVTARKANALDGEAGRRFWQRGYWDRIICDEGELARARSYILLNPARWAEHHGDA